MNRNKYKPKAKSVKITKNVFRFFVSLPTITVFVFLISSFKPSPPENIRDTKDTIYIYDTVIYYDTTYIYDTVYQDTNNQKPDSLYKFAGNLRYGNIIMQDSDLIIIKKIKQNKRKKLQLFSADLMFSPLYTIQTFKSDFIYSDFTEKNKNAVTPSIGNIFTFNFNFHRPKINFTSGFNINNIKINFSDISVKYNIDTIQKQILVPRTEMIIDSIKLINIDTLLATGDTVYYYFTDTTYNSYIDTTYKLAPDTTKIFYGNKALNSYTFFEIPLVISKNFRLENFNFTAETGIITSFFVNSKGKIVSLTDIYKTDNLTEKPKFAAVNLSYYLGLKSGYRINDKTDIITSAFFRTNLNSIFKDYPIITKLNSFGISLGLRYKFLF